MEENDNNLKNIAISYSDFRAYGCVNCGHNQCKTSVSGRGTSSVYCLKCGAPFIIFANGLIESDIKVNDTFVKLQKHPKSST